MPSEGTLVGSTFSSMGKTLPIGHQRQHSTPFTQFSSAFERSQVSSLRLGKAIKSSSVQKSAPAPPTFNQFSSGSEVSQTSQESLDNAADQAAKSALFSQPQKSSQDPIQEAANFSQQSFIRQKPGSHIQPRHSQSFRQRLDSGSPPISPTPFSKFAPSGQFFSGSWLSQPPKLDVDQALTKASEAAGIPADLANIAPVIPAVTVPTDPSKHFLEEMILDSQSINSLRSNEKIKSKSSPTTRKQSVRSPRLTSLTFVA